jgi:methylenetetrahydrofolate reductase (NADPH)
MKVIDLLKKKQTLSFEFFPPKTEEQEVRLFEVIAQLKKFNPDYVSVTYGALGTSREKTFFWVKEIKEKYGIEPVAHLTCIASDKADLETQVANLSKQGVENILALRGDLPHSEVEGAKLPFAGPQFARGLVSLIKEIKPGICVGVAGYPEKHPEGKSIEKDIEYLKEKVDAGADYIVTQLFFDNKAYFDFVDKCSKAGILVPVIPGIMPITNYKSLKKMTEICGVTIPDEILTKLENDPEDAEEIKKLGIEHTVRQCKQLQKMGVPGLHFFVMNQAGPISEILKELNSK